MGRRRDDARVDAVEPATVPPIFNPTKDRLERRRRDEKGPGATGAFFVTVLMAAFDAFLPLAGSPNVYAKPANARMRWSIQMARWSAWATGSDCSTARPV